MARLSLSTIAVVVSFLVTPRSSPPVLLSVPERENSGDGLSSPSPEGRGGQGVRTGGNQGVGIIPLPEHPRPDFQRDLWQNLNGPWQFQFDAPDSGEARGWFRGPLPAPRQIIVPFPWGSPLSGVPDSAVIGWYSRAITVPVAWAAGAWWWRLSCSRRPRATSR